MIDESALNFLFPLNAEAEDLDIEFKRMLPLQEKSGKAKLAQEICALSNHGGGWIVLGREDDGKYPASLPVELSGIDQDSINQIASSYLQPPPHCSVRWTRPPTITFDVLVIWVPTAGVSPVCGKKNGPDDTNGKTLGVKKGLHYIRKAGPVSAPIESPDEWQNVIRRCVLNDKATLLSALTTMIEKPRTTKMEDKENILNKDFDHIVDKWKLDSKEYPYDVDLSSNFACFGFQFSEKFAAKLEEIRHCLEHRPRDTRGDYQFFEIQHAPPSNPIVIENGGCDGLEVYATSEKFDHRTAWRISEALSGIEIMSYWEDTEWMKRAVERNSSRTWERGKKIWLNQQISYWENFLSAVKYIADYFQYEGAVRIIAFFCGLKGRSLGSTDIWAFRMSDYNFHQNDKFVDFEIDKMALNSEARSATIAEIVQAMNKLSQGPVVTADTVTRVRNEMGK